MELPDLLDVPASREPDRVAITFRDDGGTGAEVSFGELSARVRAASAALRDRGLRPGDRVALWMDASPDFAVVLLGILAAGGIAVPLNLRYRRRELAHVFADAAPRWWIRDAGLAAPEGLEDDEAPPVLTPEEISGGVGAGGRAGSPARPADPDRVAILLYTSGTTGRSKGAMITHANLLATISSLQLAWGWTAADVLLLTLPLFHTHGLVVGLLTALAAGARVELRARFRADAVAEELAAGVATVYFGVPTTHHRLLAELEARPDRRPRGLRLVCSGSAPLPAETWERFRRVTGLEILERYGMTEAGMILSNPLAGRRLPGTVGTPLPGVAVCLVDPEGRRVPDGEQGEVLVRGGNVFRGYWGLPEATGEAFWTDPEDGRRWLRSGDLGTRDPESGVVTLLGRRSELILCGGFNVYPREIEELLLEQPGIREAAVAAAPDPDLGQVPVAYLVCDGELDEDGLAAACRRDLAAFKTPRRWVRVAELPRNALGKVQKHLLGPG